MKKYIILTNQGFTESPTNKSVENQQVLGYAVGNNENEAIKRLLRENPHIIESGFDEGEIMAKILK